MLIPPRSLLKTRPWIINHLYMLHKTTFSIKQFEECFKFVIKQNIVKPTSAHTATLSGFTPPSTSMSRVADIARRRRTWRQKDKQYKVEFPGFEALGTSGIQVNHCIIRLIYKRGNHEIRVNRVFVFCGLLFNISCVLNSQCFFYTTGPYF